MRTYQEILANIGKKKLAPVYMLHGEEPFFIDLIARALEDGVLSEGEKAFNLSIFYGKDTDHLAVLDAARRFPIMSSFQLVLIREAQDMRTLEELAAYVAKPASSTVLVICYKNKKFNMNSALGKALKAQAEVFESKRVYDNKVPEWVVEYLKARQLRISPDTAMKVAEFLGNDLSRLANEMDKLALNLPQGAEVTAKVVETYIGLSKDFNVFELQKAIGRRDILKANQILRYFISNPKRNPLPVVIGALYNFFSKMYVLNALRNSPESEQLEALELRSSFFLKDYREALRYLNMERSMTAIAVLKAYDLKMKGVGVAASTDESDLLTEMIWKLLHL
jgi:DNA polymerase-3 subunit delta